MTGYKPGEKSGLALGRLLNTLSTNGDEPHTYDAGTRLKELSQRLWWFIALRWLFTGGCLALALVARLQLMPAAIDYRFLLITGVFLGATNLLFTRLMKSFTRGGLNTRGIRVLVIVQTLTDYMAISLVSYALGGVETPVIVLFLGEIILVTLFCKRAISLVMALVGAFFAVLPVILEYAGVIPALSLYNATFKTALSSDLHFTLSYIVGVTVVFLYFWYLVSEITTSLRLREHQLEKTYNKLMLLDQEKTQATLRATHELKAPLAAINSYVYALRDGYAGEISDKGRQALERIGDRADLLMKKVVDIIQLSNIKTLVLKQAHLTALNLTEVLAGEVKEAQVLGKRRNIRIVNQAHGAPPYLICGSPEHLRTLISNLLRNAITYSKNNFSVEVSLQGKRDRVTLSIQDHGIGIPEKNLDRIFEEHFRSNNAVAHNPNGTGLGLPVIKAVARLHHAVIRVSSELDKGTRFNVTFHLIHPNQNEDAKNGQSSNHRR